MKASSIVRSYRSSRRRCSARSAARRSRRRRRKQRATPEFFAAHSIAELETWDDYALGKQGRITHPMLLEQGDTHYRPVTWERAFQIVKEELQKLADPDEAVFYTSGRSSNESAFTYGLFVRSFGTNNLPDCSNMCHESTSIGLAQVMGVGKASVSLTDLEHADLILIAGQNPGTNAPRMLTRLENAKKNGGKIVAINPLREAGLLHFDNPQSVKGLVFRGTQLADEFLQIKLAGDQAAVPGAGQGADRAGRRARRHRARPRLHRAVHQRLRGLPRPRGGPRLGGRRAGDRAARAADPQGRGG